MARDERGEAISQALLNKWEPIRRERAEQMKAIFDERIDELATRGGQPFSDVYRILVPREEEDSGQEEQA